MVGWTPPDGKCPFLASVDIYNALSYDPYVEAQDLDKTNRRIRQVSKYLHSDTFHKPPPGVQFKNLTALASILKGIRCSEVRQNGELVTSEPMPETEQKLADALRDI